MGTTIAAAAAGVSFLLYSAAEAYPLFCVGAAISGVSYGLGSMIPVSILINRWFYQHRALALSICASGSGIATIVLPPVTTALVENLSMATTFRIEAVAIFLLAAVIFLALRNQPADKGLLPCGQTLLFGGILVVGHVLCCLAFTQSLVLAVLTVLFLGLGYPIATMGPSVWSNDLAAPKQYPTVVRRLQVIYAGGALAISSLPGILADHLGGYLPAYLLFTTINVLSLVCIALSYRAGKTARQPRS